MVYCGCCGFFLKFLLLEKMRRMVLVFFGKYILMKKRRKILFKGLNIIDLILFFFLDKLFFIIVMIF